MAVLVTTQPVWAKRYIKKDDKSSRETIRRSKGRAGVKSQKDWNWKNSSRSESIKEDVDRNRRKKENEYQGRLSGRERRLELRKKKKKDRINRRKNDRNRATRTAVGDTRFKDDDREWKGGCVKYTPEGPMKVEKEEAGKK